jgi:hypothetical protein
LLHYLRRAAARGDPDVHVTRIGSGLHNEMIIEQTRPVGKCAPGAAIE